MRQAQRAGFAEADPSTDLQGIDSAHKLAILCHEAFGIDLNPEEIPTSGITDCRPADIEASSRAGSVLRLIARATRHADGTVQPEVVAEYRPANEPTALIEAEENHLRISTAKGEVTEILGRGAGRCPTATAVFADLDDLYRVRVLHELDRDSADANTELEVVA